MHLNLGPELQLPDLVSDEASRDKHLHFLVLPFNSNACSCRKRQRVEICLREFQSTSKATII